MERVKWKSKKGHWKNQLVSGLSTAKGNWNCSGNGQVVFPHPGRNSYALIGLRRTGKTAILHKIFNRLFNEQDRVLPVYISFVQYLNQPKPINAFQFAEEYFAGYVRSYLAFRDGQPQLHRQKAR